MTSWPCSASRAAATDESTPPDIATTMRMFWMPVYPMNHLCGSLFSARLWCSRRDSRFSRQPSQFLDEPRQHLDHPLDFLAGREHAEAEAKRVLRAVRREPHRAQHVGRLERSGRACRSGRHGDPFEIERDEQALSFDAVEADVRRIWHATIACAVDGCALDGCDYARLEAIAQLGDARRL